MIAKACRENVFDMASGIVLGCVNRVRVRPQRQVLSLTHLEDLRVGAIDGRTFSGNIKVWARRE